MFVAMVFLRNESLATRCTAADDLLSKPTLVLDAGGHTAVIKEVLFTPDGKQLITVSEDKTIRLWDVESGQTVRVLRPPIARGPQGKLYAAAISPDGATLAVGGYGFEGDGGRIYLIDLPSGKIRQTLRGHGNAIHSLAFSSDGQLLASGSGDNIAAVWDPNTGAHRQVFKGHNSTVSGVAFSPDASRLATASMDGSAAIWSVATGRTEAILRGHSAGIRGLAWSPDGRTIATAGYDQSVRLWEANGTLRQSIRTLAQGPHVAGTVSFSPDSRFLLVATGGPENRNNLAIILDVASGRQLVKFTGHNNTVQDVAFSPDGVLAATSGGNDNEVYLWNTADGSVVRRLAGKGACIWTCAWYSDERSIAWGTSPRFVGFNNYGTPERGFSLIDLEFVSLPDAGLVRAQEARDGFTLQRLDGFNLAINYQNQTVGRLTSQPLHDGSIQSSTMLSNLRAALGMDAGVTLVDLRNGVRLRTFQGHTGAVWSVATSPSGRYLLSGSGDQTLRVWSPELEEPLVSLFFAGDEWIAWTPEGYYAASSGGERLVGWQVSNGPEQMSSYYPAAQFRKSLYRPDVVKLLLTAGSTSRAVQVAGEETGRATQLTRADDVLPPEVAITAPGPSPVQVDQPRVELHATATPKGRDPITGLRVLVDGRPYVELKHSDPAVKPVTASWPLVLEPGTHRITVKADTGKSYGLSQPVEVTYAAKESEQELPSLYVLAVGISEYEDQKLRLAYGAADARGLAETLQKKAAGVYRKVDQKVIVDGEATQRNILRGLDWLRKQVTQRDVAVVFFAGHGAKDDQGLLYLLPADCSVEDLNVSGISEGQIKQFFQAIPCRLMLLLDACHAGAVGGDRRRAIGGLTDNLVRDLISDDYGLVVMCSSMGREESREQDDWGHGAFTKALIEGLEGQADYNRDRSIYLNELDLYVAERVKELTGGHQHPVTQKPTSIRNFPLTRP